MKKAVSILLSLVLLLTTLWSVLSVSMAASTGTDYFETPANWKFYNNGTTIGGDSASFSKIRSETGATYVREGGSSLYMSAHSYVPAIKLPNLELNKMYTLSFWYLAPSGSICTSTKAWLTTPGVYKSGEHAVGSNAAIDGTANAVAVGVNGAGAGNLANGTPGDDTFHKYSITFETNATTGTDLYFAWRQWVTGYGTLYFDDFSLEEVNPYAMASNWGYYNGGESLGGTFAAAQYVTQNTTTVKNGPSVEFGGTTHGKAPAIKLNGLEAGKTYSVSFWYNCVQMISNTTETTYQLHNIGIYKAGATKGSGNAVIDSAGGNTVASCAAVNSLTPNTWYQHEFKFSVTAGDLDKDLYLALAPWRVNLFLISDLTVTEVDYYNTNTNWNRMGSGATIGTDTNHAHVLADTEKTYNGGKESIRFVGTMHGQSASIPLQVEANKSYKLSFKYCATLTTSPATSDYDILVSGVYQKGAVTANNNITGTAVANASKKTHTDADWHDYELNFTVDNVTDLYFVAVFWTAQDVWFDDITLEETTPPKADDAYFEDAGNWYILSGTSSDIPDNKSDWAHSAGWSSVSGTTATANVKTDKKAIQYYGQNHPAFIPLKDLKANRNYTLSFYYKGANVSTQSGNPYMIAGSGIYTKNPNITAGDAKVTGLTDTSDGYIVFRGRTGAFTSPTGDYSQRTYNADLLTWGAEADEWNYIEYNFNTNNFTDLYFVLYCVVSGHTVYLDDFTLYEHPYEAPDMTWKMHSSSTKVFGENATTITYASVSKTKEQNYTGEGDDGDLYSYKLTGGYAQYPATKISFEKNKYYNLTFYYYGTELDSNNGMFSHVKLVKEGGTHADTTSDNLAYLDRNTCYYTNKMGAMIKLDGKVNSGVSKNAWNKVTLSFYSGDLNSAWLALRPTVQSAVYVDNFILTETTELPKANQGIRLTWNTVNSGTTVFGDGQKTAYGTFEEDETLICPDAVNDGYSNKLMPNNYAQYATTKLENLEKDTYYYLTFYYYGSVLGSNNSMFSDAKVVKDGGANSSSGPDNLGHVTRTGVTYANKNGLNAPFAGGTVLANATANAWNKVVIPFYTGDATTAWLALRHTASSTTDATAPQNAAPVWVDGIKVEKTTDQFPYTEEIPFSGWNGPQDEHLITFDDYFVSVSPSTRVEVTDAPAKDGKENNRAIHFIPGTYASAFRMNDSTINKDLVFTIPVDENSLYKFSYWIYVVEKEPSIPYFGFYYDFDSTWLLRSSGLQERGKWVKREITFTTKPGMTKLGLTINPGEIVRDIYVDDILVKRLNPGVVADASDASYCDEFYDVLAEQDLVKTISAAKSGAYKVKVDPMTQYTFAATVKGNKNSKIYLSNDGVTPIGKSDKDSPEAVITASKTETRYAYTFISDKSGYIYIVVENDDGSMMIEDPQIFRTASISTNLPIGLEAKPLMSLNENKVGKLTELKLLGESANAGAEGDAATGESPETGSSPILPMLLVFITALTFCGLLFKTKKGGEQA